MSPREKIVAAAREMVGVRWMHGGRTSKGIDCIGLALHAVRAGGLEVPDPPPYAPEPNDTQLFRELSRYGRQTTTPAPGDILLFRTNVYGGHLGILAEHPSYGVPSIIHAMLRRRAVVEEPYTDEHRVALISAFMLEIH